jgi:general secretion pathway protein A
MANFGLGDTPGTEKSALLRRFEHSVRDHHKHGRRCLLVIDEVQNLSLAAMEELRMLSNIVVDGKASVQTILLGQPQFRSILASQDWEQLRQRVLASFHLGPLTKDETGRYIQHRLQMVDWHDDPVWNDAAFAAVHRHTGGIPRRINTLCSRVLLFGALEELHIITGEIVDNTAEELNRDLGTDLELAGRLVQGNRDDVSRRIDQLEHSASRQEQMLKRVMELLEANAVGRT